jgi:hypothetical protein
MVELLWNLPSHAQIVWGKIGRDYGTEIICAEWSIAGLGLFPPLKTQLSQEGF